MMKVITENTEEEWNLSKLFWWIRWYIIKNAIFIKYIFFSLANFHNIVMSSPSDDESEEFSDKCEEFSHKSEELSD